MADQEIVNVRYLVDDPAASVDFYTRHFGFTVGISSPAFADVTRGNLRLLLSGPMSSAGRATKPLTRFARSHFDRVITLCDKVREICPEFPGAPILAHWSIADPAAAGDSDKATYPTFEHVADEIEGRVAVLLADLGTPPMERTHHARS